MQPKNDWPDLPERLDRIEQMLATLIQEKTVKAMYSTAEIAEIIGKAEYTVREYCRLGRVKAIKKACGRGKGGEWLISHEELQRLRSYGPS
jgi:hypothetical protein